MRSRVLGLVVLFLGCGPLGPAERPTATSPSPVVLAQPPEPERPAVEAPPQQAATTDACDRLDPGSDQLCRDRAVDVLSECDSITADLPCRAIVACLIYRAESIRLRDELCQPDASKPECIVTQRKLTERGTVAECASRQRRAQSVAPSGA